MHDSETLVTYHKALMKLSHGARFIDQPRLQKLVALTELCSDLLGVERVSIWYFSSSQDRIICECLHPQTMAPEAMAAQEVSLYRKDHPAYFDAMVAERVIAVEEAATDPRTASFTETYLKPQHIRSMLDAPIFDGHGLSGVICLETHVQRAWSLPDISLVVAIADTVSFMNTQDAWARSQHALDYITHFDAHTGLANLSSLRERVGELISVCKRRGAGSLALVWIDVDRLKAINDGLGAQAGDEVISELAGRLKELPTQNQEMLARIGGDEFAVVIRNSRPESVARVATQIQDLIRRPIRIADQELSVSASLGICQFPGDCENVEDLLRGAEAAMYHAKHLGRAQSTLFDSAIQVTARSRFELENDLRAALDHGGLDVFYQPIMDRTASQVVSLEALVRWHHPTRGWLPPIEFLDVARSAGLMFELGKRVLEIVCGHWRDSRDAGVHLPTIAVNLAAEQVMIPELPGLIEHLCRKQNMPVHALAFEVTEDAIQGEQGKLGDILQQLVAAGAELSIDDFGTGYSSLSRLKGLPFSRIKIDRSFIKNLPDDDDDRAITLSILGLARGLGLSVVAEGVETEAHEQWLFDNGCDYLQGFRYSKPLPLAELTPAFLSKFSQD